MYLIVCVSSRVIVQRYSELSRAKDWLADNNVVDGEPVKLFEIVKESQYMKDKP